MADKLQLLVEANNRGLLKGQHKAMYDEAVSRGLIKPSKPETESGISAAFGAGVDKVQELGYRAVKGFTDVGVPKEEQTGAIGKAIGQGGSLSEWAQEGIDRNVKEQEAYEPTVKSYKDIGGLSDLGSYAGELVAGSIPYMAGAATGVGAFGMAGGLSNEAYEKQPEGEKDEVRAVASGAGQMLLERLGIKVSMGQLGKDLMRDGVMETAKRMGKGELVEAVRDPSFARRILKGSAVEGLTETGQEALAQWGAGKSIDELEGLDEAFVGGFVVGGAMRGGSEAAQKVMGYQQKTAEAAQQGVEQMVEAGASQEEAIDIVRKQQYDAAKKQGLSDVEAAAVVARTMKEKFGIDDPLFSAAAEAAPETEAEPTIPEDTETPVFKNDDVDYDAPTAARQAGFDQTSKAAGQYGDMLTSPAQQSLKDLDAGNNSPTVDERVKAAAFDKSPTPEDRFSPMKYQHEGELLKAESQRAEGIDKAPIDGQTVPEQGKLPTSQQTKSRQDQEQAKADFDAQAKGIEQKDIIFGEDGRPQQRAAEQVKQAGKDSQNLLPNKDIVFAGDESGVNVSKTGEPFKTKRDALLSKEARAARRAGQKTKAVNFGGGFGWKIKNDSKSDDSDLAAGTQSPDSDTVAQSSQDDNAQPAQQDGPVSFNVDAAPGKDEEDKNITANDQVSGVDVINTPVSELSLSKDIPQFKSGSNANGVVEPLTGKFDPVGMSPVQVWVRNDGKKEIITGRHRYDLAKRDGVDNIPAQYHFEKDGFTAEDGKRLDAILNIREDKGQVEDYVELFKQDGITEAEAKQFGLLDRAIGRSAFKIANSATNETIEAQRSGRISAQAAEAIADAAPGNERLQVLGIKSVADDQRSITFAKNLIHAVSALDKTNSQESQSGDLFGFDDSAMQEAEQMAKVAATNQREIRNRLNAIRGAANKPEIAKAEGVNVKNPKALKKRTDELAQEVKAWDSWHTNPEMVQQIRNSISAPNTETIAPISAPNTETKAEPEAIEQDNGPDMFADSEPPLFDNQEINLNYPEIPDSSKSNSNESKLDNAASKISSKKLEAAEKLKKLMASKKGQLNSGIDPEVMLAVAEVGALSIAEGAVKFAQWTRDVLNTTRAVGLADEDVKPFLKEAYGAIGANPEKYGVESNADDMSGFSEIRKFDLNTIEGDGNVSATSENMEQASASENTEQGAKSRDDVESNGSKQVPSGAKQDTAAIERSDSEPSVSTNDGAIQGAQSTSDLLNSNGSIRSNENTSSAGNDGRSNSDNDNGAQIEPETTTAVDEATKRVATDKQAQQTADNTSHSAKWGDETDILKSVPVLMREQAGDIAKIESRFFGKENAGPGYQNTNGTGTGKTFVGLGVLKRFAQSGKTNALVAVPNDGIAQQWVQAAKEHFGLDVYLIGTDGGAKAKDAGRGITITTYSTLGNNDQLIKNRDNFDLIIADESQNLMGSQQAKTTNALASLRALTNHEEGSNRRAKAYLTDEIEALDKKIKAKAKQLLATSKNETEALNDAKEFYQKERTQLNNQVQALATEFKKEGPTDSKVLFLSATPFPYVKNLDYAEGYLFNYTDYGDKFEGGYDNAFTGRNAFYIQNFGYRWRYHKLNTPGSDVDQSLMERQFHETMKEKGVLGGRTLEVEADYKRDFIKVETAAGEKLDDLIEKWRDHTVGGEGEGETSERPYSELADVLNKTFDYTKKIKLTEAIKAEEAVERAKEHIKNGRKVVLFHSYNVGGSFDPVEEVRKAKPELLSQFEAEFPRMTNINFGVLARPLDLFAEEFGDSVRFYNGNVPDKARKEAKDLFNDDNSGVDVIVVQQEAGEAGISLHDTTGGKQRVLINIGMPVKPTQFIQIEGRIYRVGVKTDAQFENLTTGTAFERNIFASKIAGRASTAENLAMGEFARSLKENISEGYLDASYLPVGSDIGKGGKTSDRPTAIDAWDKAKSFYYANLKRNASTKSAEGDDYFATPEPVGKKMVEWLQPLPGHRMLEPSVGHAAIGRWFPGTTRNKATEKSFKLTSLAQMNFPGEVDNIPFEDLNVINKFEGVAMNPPFGKGGKLAYDHVRKAIKHLVNGGRIVALVPDGPAANKRLDALLTDENLSNIYQAAEIDLPAGAFGRAGTGVKTKIVVLDRFDNSDDAPNMQRISFANAKDVNDLFDRIKDVELKERKQPTPVEYDIAQYMDASSKPTKNRKGEDAYQVKLYGYLPNEVKSVIDKEGTGEFGAFPNRDERIYTLDSDEARQDFAQFIAQTIEEAKESGVKFDFKVPTPKQEKPRVEGQQSNEYFKATGDTYTTKRGKEYLVTEMVDRQDRETYSALKELAKDYGGWAQGQKFMFKTLDDITQFNAQAKALIDGGINEGSGGYKVNEPTPAAAPSQISLDFSYKPNDKVAKVDKQKTEKAKRSINKKSNVQNIDTDYLTYSGEPVVTPEDAASAIAAIRKMANEQMTALVTDGDGNVLNVIRHSIGNNRSAVVDPATLAGSVVDIPGAEVVWFAHNHPTGNPTQSGADLSITQKMAKILDGSGVQLKGMITVGSGDKATYYDVSNQQKDYPITTKPAIRSARVPVSERRIRGRKIIHEAIGSANDAQKMIKAVSGGKNGVALLNNKLEAIQFMPLSLDEMKSLKSGKLRELLGNIHGANASAAILSVNENINDAKPSVANMVSLFEMLDVTIHDTINPTGESQTWASVSAMPRALNVFFSKKSGEKKGKGISEGAAQSAANKFIESLSGANGIQVKILKDNAHAESIWRMSLKGATVKGAYSNNTKTVYVIADNISSINDLNQTLAHEIIAHGGLDTAISKEDYKKFIDRIKQTRGRKAFAKYWANADKDYKGESADVKAEEIFARFVEEKPQQNELKRWWSGIKRLLARALSAVGVNVNSETAFMDDMIDAINKGFTSNKAELVGKARADKNLFSKKGGVTISDNFKRWFGNSKVIDSEGAPLIVHHGGAKFDTFDRDKLGSLTGADSSKLGFFFTDSRGLAYDFQEESDKSALNKEFILDEINKLPISKREDLFDDLGMDVFHGDLEYADSESERMEMLSEGLNEIAQTLEDDANTIPMDRSNYLPVVKRYLGNDFFEVGEVKDVYLKMENPLIASFEDGDNEYQESAVTKLMEEAIKNGNDGIIIKGMMDGFPTDEKGNGIDNVSTVYAVLNPNQIKSATGNNGDFNADSDNIMFSRTTDEDTRTAKQKLGLEEQAAETMSDVVKGKVNGTIETLKSAPFWNRLNEGIFDGLSGIKNAEEAAGITDPNKQGYVSARLASGLADVLHGVFNYGAPQWRDGIVQRKEGTKGLLEVFGGLGSDLNNWLAWMGANRAEQLKAQGRENNLSDADIAELKALANGKERLFEQTRIEYNKINSAILDMAQEAGLLNQAQRSAFDEEYYVPFFRDMGETDPEMDDIKRMIVEPHTRKGIAGQSAQIKKLKGGTQSTKDLLENIIARQSTFIDASLKNKAMREVVRNLDGTDYLTHESSDEALSRTQQQLNNDGKVKVMIDGKPQAYLVSDPALLRALIQVNDIGNQSLFNKMGRSAKRFLTAGITLSPDFIFKNFVRDAAQAWMVNKDGFTFASDSLKGLKKAFKEDEAYRDLIFSGAAFQGGYVHGSDPEAAAQQVRRSLRKKGLSSSEIEGFMGSLVTSGANLLERYKGVSDKVENANRLSTYEAAIAAGKSKRQAAFEAKDLMDYSLKGNYKLIGTMIDMLPFFNARLQGMSKLARAAKASGDDRVLRVLSQNLAMKGIKVAIFSAILAAMNDDDERYQELPDWDKDMNWHIFVGDEPQDHWRIPKPFELGIVFGTLPERIIHYGTGTQNEKDLGKAVANAVWNTMAMNPIPQMFLPATESVMNHSFFKSAPIEGMADQNKQSQDRYNAYTSDTAKAIGEAFGVSPKKVEHLVKGYTGTIGGYVLGASDIMARQIMGVENAETPISRYPVIKSFYQGSGPKTSTKFANDFYDALDTANQAYGSYKRAMELGDTDRQKEILEEDGSKLRSRKSLAKVQRIISKLGKMQKAVNDNKTLTPKQKREKLDDIQRKKNAIYHKAYVAMNLGEW